MKITSPFRLHYRKFVHPSAIFCQMLEAKRGKSICLWAPSEILACSPSKSPHEKLLLGQIFHSERNLELSIKKTLRSVKRIPDNFLKRAVNRSMIV